MWFMGVQAAEVEVDPGTGQVRVLKMAAAHDVGRAINPANCRQQIEGSVIMGIGSTLTEEMIFDKEARLLNGNLVDYKVPTSRDADMPVEVCLIEKAHPEGPFGAKGIGEPGLVPTASAIGNAVARALGKRFFNLPMKCEELYAAIRGSQDAAPV
jgi:CO/xanthine dehydrogenase Mo-binding subunit